MSFVRVAIDSMPVACNLNTTYDYSGGQVYGLSHFTLGDLLEYSETNRNTISIPVRNLSWANGDCVTPRHYLNGISNVMKTNSLVRKVFMRNLISISIQGDCLKLKFRELTPITIESLKLPNFCPVHSDSYETSGPYSVERTTEGFRLSKRFDLGGDFPEGLDFVWIKEPDENQKLFESGDIDVTSDTSFRFSNAGSQFLHSRDSGLTFDLIFSKNLPLEVRRYVRHIAEGTDLSPIFGSHYQPLGKGTEAPMPHLTGLSLKLVYDDYYPNFEIISAIGKKLSNDGNKIDIMCDDFHRPCKWFDVRLVITRAHRESVYFKFAPYLLNAILIKDPVNHSRLWNSLMAFEFETSDLTECENEMRSVVDDIALSASLAKFPSCYFSRLNNGFNPALEALNRENIHVKS